MSNVTECYRVLSRFLLHGESVSREVLINLLRHAARTDPRTRGIKGKPTFDSRQDVRNLGVIRAGIAILDLHLRELR